LIAWAQAMGHEEVVEVLQEILDEEKAADEKLSELAEGGINQQAAETAHPEEEAGNARATAGATRQAGKGHRSGKGSRR
jgi:hypothetical protein